MQERTIATGDVHEHVALEMNPRWAIVELMGHRQVAGKISEVTQYGVTMLRVEVPSLSEPGNVFRTQDYGGSAIYCLTHCDEETALRFVRQTGWEQQAQVIGLLGGSERDDHHTPDDVADDAVRSKKASIWDGCDESPDPGDVARCMASEFDDDEDDEL